MSDDDGYDYFTFGGAAGDRYKWEPMAGEGGYEERHAYRPAPPTPGMPAPYADAPHTGAPRPTRRERRRREARSVPGALLNVAILIAAGFTATISIKAAGVVLAVGIILRVGIAIRRHLRRQ